MLSWFAEHKFNVLRRAATEKPTKEPREHDYRAMGWGHNIEMLQRVKDTERFSACGFGIGVKVGDTLLLKMESGKDARWRFTKVEYFRDPPDMFSMEMEPVEYLEDHRADSNANTKEKT